MGFWQWAQFVGTLLTVVWSAKQTAGYFSMSFDEVIADLKGAPLPLNEAGVAYWKSMLTPYYGE